MRILSCAGFAVCAIAVVGTGAALADLRFAASPRAAGTSCAAATPYRPKVVADRVPAIVQAHMAPTPDGGLIVAFASYDGTRRYPASRHTVLGIDASACVRWRASVRGGWPIATPAVAGRATVVVVSVAKERDRARLELHTLSLATGRVLRRERLPLPPGTSGTQPAVVHDRRGNVAGVGSVDDTTGRSDRTIKVTRAARTPRWTRQLVARPGVEPPAVASLPDGRLAIAYARRGQLFVRTGTVAGRPGAPVAAGRLGGNFRSAAIAIGDDGTIAVAWQSGTYSRPWRLHVAVRPAGARRFARPAQLGYAAAENGTLFEGSSPALRIDDGKVTIGFDAPEPDTGGRPRVMCAVSAAGGRLSRPRPFTDLRPVDGTSKIVLGRTAMAAMMLAVPDPDGDGRTLVATGSGCWATSSHLLAPEAGHPLAALAGVRDRIWMLSQAQATTGAITLTVSGR